MASTNASSQSISIRVLVAGTGVTYKISLPLSELTVANIRSHLAAAVPPSDQILLLGPPYKVPKDSTLQSEEILQSLRFGDLEDDPIPEEPSSVAGSQTRNIYVASERSGSRRLFLFSKTALTQNAPDPPPCQLEPVTLQLPTQAPGPSPLNMESPAPPLHQALAAFERQFMLNLAQGRVLADGADLRLQACKQCVQEQIIMSRALRAAVSNLSDHFNAATRTRTQFTNTFHQKSASYARLLQNFETTLLKLQSLPLHPSLVSIARASGRVMETLLDTVPVDRERAWAQQCNASHQRLVQLFNELDATFATLGTPTSREEEARRDAASEQEILNLWREVEDTAQPLRDRQAQQLEKLTADHKRVVQVIMQAVESDDGDAMKVQAAFGPLQEMTNASKDIVPSMLADDTALLQLMLKVADHKTKGMKRMQQRLREVSQAQSSIQRVMSSVTVLKDALLQQGENMAHLEHVEKLEDSYLHFLKEARRRRAYGEAIASSTAAMMERIAAMRDDELKAREKFLRGPGRHLMPPFYDIFVPTLSIPPQLFTPQLPVMVELDTIPDVGLPPEDEEPVDTAMATTATPMEQAIESSASILTASENRRMQEAPVQPEAAQDQLIVSADENSSNDLIMGGGHATEEDAERKRLAYENAMLRQALEDSGKSARALLEGSKATTLVPPDADDNKLLASLRKELADTKAHVASLQEQLKATPEVNDKISHYSFRVGDVGLFMPTGRGSGGKRTYLAFHSNCPHRYLSTDNIKGTPNFVLGRIIYQEELVAGEVGTDANPYGLHVGTKFWVLTVEVLGSSSISK